MAVRKPIRRALVSVYDKTGLEELGKELNNAGVEIVSTGSTARILQEAGVTVTPVEQVTGFPECLDGRVKTLHPKIHAGILADLRLDTHVKQLAELDVRPFDLVVSNLYPFADTVESGADFDQCIEQIDIGGPSMVRAAAKNHASVAIVTSADQYVWLYEAIQLGGTTEEDRRKLAAEAFRHTSEYDTAVAEWFAEQCCDQESCCGGGCCRGEQDCACAVDEGVFPEFMSPIWGLENELRYGENPHQKAAVYVELNITDEGEITTANVGLAGARQLGGKEMSYNNYQDADAALRAAYDHAEPCVAIIKHANPCGIAIADGIAEAHRKAHACDPVSAYGGVIAANREVDEEMAKQVKPIFTEVILAPSFSETALEVLKSKKNLRILEVNPPERGDLELKQISGGLLVQQKDDVDDAGDDPANWQLVAGNPADEQTMKDLVFAWHSVRAVKSNAILLVKDGASVGVGMGQVNRVDSAKLAVERANTLGGRSTGDAAGEKIDSAGGARAADLVGDSDLRAQGSVGASDAFFPFADGLQILIDAGVKAVVQPGGSIRDEEVIEAAKNAGITMYFTGNRHFFH